MRREGGPLLRGSKIQSPARRGSVSGKGGISRWRIDGQRDGDGGRCGRRAVGAEVGKRVVGFGNGNGMWTRAAGADEKRFEEVEEVPVQWVCWPACQSGIP